MKLLPGLRHGDARMGECERKRDYRTHEAAQKAIEAMEAKHPGERFLSYRCKHCDGVHIGHRKDSPR